MYDEWWLRPEATVLATGLTFEQCMHLFMGQHIEFVDGMVFRPAPVTIEHQDMRFYLHALLDAYLALNPIGFTRGLKFTMKLSEMIAREPDVFLILNENAHKMTQTYFDGAADLVIEVVQPGSESDIYGAKFVQYEKAGVQEYWIIDPTRRNAVFFRQVESGTFFRNTEDTGGNYTTPLLPKFRLHVPTLWETPLPNIYETGETVRAMWESEA
ncbi:MAG: Uma2 family endonuclease [Anaerolineae bacterium]|nr:Uma2 family endonuclease [Anaerolineae bacterium]